MKTVILMEGRVRNRGAFWVLFDVNALEWSEKPSRILAVPYQLDNYRDTFQITMMKAMV